MFLGLRCFLFLQPCGAAFCDRCCLGIVRRLIDEPTFQMGLAGMTSFQNLRLLLGSPGQVCWCAGQVASSFGHFTLLEQKKSDQDGSVMCRLVELFRFYQAVSRKR